MFYWLIREDGWIADIQWANTPDDAPDGYTPLPDGISNPPDLNPWPDLWYIDGALVAQPMPQQ